MRLADHYFPSAGEGNVPIRHMGQLRRAEWCWLEGILAEIILRSSHCQVFRLTMVCVYAYMDIPGQSEGGLLNKSFFALFLLFSIFLSLSLFITF